MVVGIPGTASIFISEMRKTYIMDHILCIDDQLYGFIYYHQMNFPWHYHIIVVIGVGPVSDLKDLIWLH